MRLKPLRYPRDLTGKSPDNFVQDEPHDLLPGREVRVVVPSHTPFYVNSVVITDLANGQVVESSKYYVPVFEESLQRVTGEEIGELIAISDKSVSDHITVSYQTVGGEYSLSSSGLIQQQIQQLSLDNRPVVFNAILNKPKHYPPSKHLHPLSDIYGFETVVYAVDRLTEAVALGSIAQYLNIFNYIDKRDQSITEHVTIVNELLEDHIQSKDNPHEVTTEQIGTYTKKQIDDKDKAINEYITVLQTKIYGSPVASKPIKSFLPLSPKYDNELSWDSKQGGYYQGPSNVENSSHVYVDNVNGKDIALSVEKDRGSNIDKPFRTLSFALDQTHGFNGYTLYCLKEGQTHVLKRKNYYLKGGTHWVFTTYSTVGGIATVGFNTGSFTDLKDTLTQRGAKLVLADVIDTSTATGYITNPVGTMFEPLNHLRDCSISFSGLNVEISKSYNSQDVLSTIDNKGYSNAKKKLIKRAFDVESQGLIRIQRVNFDNCHFTSTIDNPPGLRPLTVLAGEMFLTIRGPCWFSNKLWDLDFSPDCMSKLEVVNPELVYIDDNSRCTVPTPLSQAFTYLIDQLEPGDSHYHWVNLLTNIRPNYLLSGQVLDYSTDYITGVVSCDRYYINTKPATASRGTSGPVVTPVADIVIALLFKDNKNRVYVKKVDDNKYYQIYPAVWQGDSPVQPKLHINQPQKLLTKFQDKRKDNYYLPTFYAVSEDNSFIRQVYPGIWADYDDVNSKLDKGTEVVSSYVYYSNTDNRFHISTVDRHIQKQLYPALWGDHNSDIQRTIPYEPGKP